jgi:hypothetical protein
MNSGDGIAVGWLNQIDPFNDINWKIGWIGSLSIFYVFKNVQLNQSL